MSERRLLKKVAANDMTSAATWWRRVDSNHRSETQQIYSLPPLATRELLHIQLSSPVLSRRRRLTKPKPSGAGSVLRGEAREHSEECPLAGVPNEADFASTMELVDGFEPPTC